MLSDLTDRKCREMPAQVLFIALLILSGVGASSLFAQDGQNRVRNVTPENIPVIILPPRIAPVNSPKTAREVAIVGDKLKAMLSEDGVITADGKTLTLVGVRLIPSTALCETESGSRWACGLRAFVTLRNVLHTKDIICETLAQRDGVAIARCFREQQNISEIMIADGWALYDDSAKDETLSSAARDAHKHARGVWQNGSRILSND